MKEEKARISLSDFQKIDLRIGTVLKAYPNEEAKKPSIVLEIDFGPELGIMKSSAQITELYQADELVGNQVTAVVNFPPVQIARMQSQCLVLGAVQSDGKVVLLQPDRISENGAKIS